MSSSGAKTRVTVDALMRYVGIYLSPDDVTEIAVNKPGEIWQKYFSGWKCSSAPELSKSHLNAIVTALATYNGMNTSSLMYLTLPDGERGTVAAEPAVIDGTLSFLIRKHAQVVKTLAQLENDGIFNQCEDVSFNLPDEAERKRLLAARGFEKLSEQEVFLLELKEKGDYAEFLRQAVLAKQNIIIAGKTGSGKTTLARSLIETVPTTERLGTIEDVHELALPNHPNKFHMLFGTGPGRLSASECLRACMRMSPDRIFLAELRGDEAWEYILGLNTGHPGSISTTHANDAKQTFGRIASLIKTSEIGRDLSMETIRAEIHKTLNVVVFMHNRQVLQVFFDPMFSRQAASEG